MFAITSLILPAVFCVALLLPECELWFLDEAWRDAPHEALVDFTICNGAEDGIAANAFACLPDFIVAPGEDDDADED